MFVHGELWNARSDREIDENEKVRIVNVVNLMLEVESADQTPAEIKKT